MLLRVENLEVVYSDVILAVNGISLEVPPKGRVAFLGANGAGKTTTLRAITGLLGFHNGKITGGRIEFAGEEITGRNAQAIIRRGLAHVPEGRKVFPHLTVEENLLVGASASRNPLEKRKDLRRVYDYFPKLADRRSQTAGYLSGGEQQMLVVGRALMARPIMLAVDELSLGLAPLVVQDLIVSLANINREEEMAILLVEQNARLALNFAEYGYIVENGRVVLDGPAEVLKRNEDVKEFYLGMSGAGTRKSYTEVKHYKRRKRWLS